MNERRGAKSSTVGSRRSPRPAGKTVFGLLCACVLALGVFLGGGEDAAAAEACPNEAIRELEGATALPECRAYEQVSPVDKSGGDIFAFPEVIAADGHAMTYTSGAAFAGVPGAGTTVQYLSTRGAADWTTEGITPAYTNNGIGAGVVPEYKAFSDDLSHMIVAYNLPGAPYELWLRNPDGLLESVTPGATTSTGAGGASFGGASRDYSHVLFTSPDNLTPDSLGLPSGGQNQKVYEWSAGKLRLVSVLPDGSPSLGSVPVVLNLMSGGGERIYWQGEGPTGFASGPIYLSAGGSTTPVSADQTGTVQNGTLRAVTPDGLHALFTSPSRLTGVSSPAGPDLYSYDVAAGHLTDLTPDPTNALVGGAVGISDDGAYVYFAAGAVLATGGTEDPGMNLYVWHGGTTTFIATLPSADSNIWHASPEVKARSAQVTADGEHLLFRSQAPLDPSYDNAGHTEIYLYDAPSAALTCLSCNAGAGPAGADAALAPRGTKGGLNGTGGAVFSPINNLSPDASRVFFETDESLLPADTNGKSDVYLSEAAGTGECGTGAVGGRCLYLISSGSGAVGAHFQNASRSADDAFILTRDRLVSQDVDGNLDIYDARVDGGFVSQNPPPAAGEGCDGAACQSSTPPPPSSVPGSTTLQGAGNVASPRDCGKSARQAKNLAARAKRLRKHAKQAKRNGKGAVARKRAKKATRLARQARTKHKAAKRCRKADRGAVK